MAIFGIFSKKKLEKSNIVTFCFRNQSVKMTHFDLGKSHKAICGFYLVV